MVNILYKYTGTNIVGNLQSVCYWRFHCIYVCPPTQKHNVIEELCDIALSDPMVSTIKLHALRSMDTLLDYPQGLERFLGWSKSVSSSSSLVAPLPPTPYQHMINLVLSQPVKAL